MNAQRGRPSLRGAWLGQGLAFPTLPQEGSRQLSTAGGPEKVRQSLWLILDTEPGERLMRPDFGCGLRQYLMQPNSAQLRALIRREVERAVGTWEPRVHLQSVRVEAAEDPSVILVQVHYAHRHDGSPGNLVYPFYLEGGPA